MSIELKNNVLKIGNLNNTFNHNFQNQDFSVKLSKNISTGNISDNPGIENFITTESFLEEANNLYNEINFSSESFEIIAVVSNNDNDNIQKLGIQKEILSKHYDDLASYEFILKENIGFDDLVQNIELVSKRYLSFYSEIESIITNSFSINNNYGNKVIEFFKGKKSYNLGKVIYWANKSLDINHDIENYHSLKRNASFLSDETSRFYDFKKIYADSNLQEKFIVNDLLINRSYYSQVNNSDHIENTVEIVAQSLINLGKSMFLPAHTSFVCTQDTQQKYYDYMTRLNNIEVQSRLSKYPTLKTKVVPQGIKSYALNTMLNITSLEDQINFNRSNLNSDRSILERLPNNVQTIKYSDNLSSLDDNNFIKPFTRNSFSTVISREPRMVDVEPHRVKISFLRRIIHDFYSTYNNNIEYTHFKNINNNNDDNDTRLNFYNIFDFVGSTFKFINFIKKINIQDLFVTVDTVINNIKLKKLENDNIDYSFIKDNLKKALSIEKNLVIGNKENNCLINVNNPGDNIFFKENIFLNNFKSNLNIENYKINSTLKNLINQENNFNFESIEAKKEMLEEVINSYYPENMFKNTFEFFKKIIKDFSSSRFKNYVNSNDFDYQRDFLYFKTILFKNKNNKNVSNLFFAKAIQEILNIKIDESIFDNQLFNIDIVYEGAKSDLLDSSQNFITLNNVTSAEYVSVNRSTPWPGILLNVNFTPFGSFITPAAILDYDRTYKDVGANDASDEVIAQRNAEIDSEIEVLEDLIESIEQGNLPELPSDFSESSERLDEWLVRHDYLSRAQADEALETLNNRPTRSRPANSQEYQQAFKPFIIATANQKIDNLEDAKESPGIYVYQAKYNKTLTEYYKNSVDLVPATYNVSIPGFIFAKVKKNSIDKYEFVKTLEEFKTENYHETIERSNLTFNNPNSSNNRNYFNFLLTQNRDMELFDFITQETRLRNELFITNTENINSTIIQTLKLMLKYVLPENSLENINDQDGIISFIQDNQEISSFIQEILKIYLSMFDTITNKAFYLSLFGIILKASTEPTPDNMEDLSNIKTIFGRVKNQFKERLLEEISHNEAVFNEIFVNEQVFNDVIDYRDMSDIFDISTDANLFKTFYTQNDFLLYKMFNILKRNDITKSAHFDIVYNYLVDTLEVPSKLERINTKILEKVGKLNDLNNLSIDEFDILSMVLLEKETYQILKQYYDLSIKHSYINKKIIKLKEKENVQDINFTRDILKKYHNKRYDNLINSIPNNSTNNKDVICVAIPKANVQNMSFNKIYKISVSLANHAKPGLYSYEKDFFYSPSFSANNNLLPELCINSETTDANSRVFEDQTHEIDFNISTTSETIVYFNENAKEIKDKISLITQQDLIRILKTKFLNNSQNNFFNDESNIEKVAQKMFNDYIKSGNIENTLAETISFPRKEKIFTNEAYQKNLIGIETLDLFNSFTEQEFALLFNENKNNFISNHDEVTENFVETIYPHEEFNLKTKIYSFEKLLNSLYSNSDLVECIENKKYYDFYFINLSPDDFLYEYDKNNPDPPESSGHTLQEVNENNIEELDYLIKGIGIGLKIDRTDGWSKNNYNYIIKVEEL